MKPNARRLALKLRKTSKHPGGAFSVVTGTVSEVGAGEVTVVLPTGEVDEVMYPQWYSPAVGDVVKVVVEGDGDPWVVAAF